jgi:ribosomal protein L11 methyltransferase
MSWIQVQFHLHPEQTESFEDLLMQLGAVSVTLEDAADQPVFEPDLGTTPLWNNTRLTALFPANLSVDELALGLATEAKDFGINKLPNYKFEILEDKDWEREWMENFHPMCFGRRLWICPSWREPEDSNAINLMLDPGLAFGTGTHPTTSLCLKWLDGCDLDDKSVIDYGCGSGVLGIAALLLGAKRMTGVDNDPQALIATKDNAQRNKIDEARMSLYLPEQTPDQKADIMIANILAQPLIHLAPKLAELTHSGGQIVLSGILEEQAEDVLQRYELWFTMSPAVISEGWVRLEGIRKN